MSMENVKEFLALVKTDEGLARKVVELKDNLQKGANLGSEVEILAEKVLPLAKAHGLEFTAEEFLAYANSVSGELSDDDLLNVSGGISARGVALGLLFATGLSFVPTIVSSFAVGPETSMSKNYKRLSAAKQKEENLKKSIEELEASIKKTKERLPTRNKKKKKTVSRHESNLLQQLEAKKASLEEKKQQLNKQADNVKEKELELEHLNGLKKVLETEKNQKQFSKVMTELRKVTNNRQKNMGVVLGDKERLRKEEEEHQLNAAKENGKEKMKTLSEAINNADSKGGAALNAATGLKTDLEAALDGVSAEAITQATNKVEEIVKTLNEAVANEKEKEKEKEVIEFDKEEDDEEQNNTEEDAAKIKVVLERLKNKKIIKDSDFEIDFESDDLKNILTEIELALEKNVKRILDQDEKYDKEGYKDFLKDDERQMLNKLRSNDPVINTVNDLEQTSQQLIALNDAIKEREQKKEELKRKEEEERIAREKATEEERLRKEEEERKRKEEEERIAREKAEEEERKRKEEEERIAREKDTEEKSDEQMKAELVKLLKDNSLVYSSNGKIKGFPAHIVTAMLYARYPNYSKLEVSKQIQAKKELKEKLSETKQMLTATIKEVHSEADSTQVDGLVSLCMPIISSGIIGDTLPNKGALVKQIQVKDKIDELSDTYGGTMSEESKEKLEQLKKEASGATKERLAEIEETLKETEETLKNEAEQYNAKLEDLKNRTLQINNNLYDFFYDENYDTLDAKYQAIKRELEQKKPDLKQIEAKLTELEQIAQQKLTEVVDTVANTEDNEGILQHEEEKHPKTEKEILQERLNNRNIDLFGLSDNKKKLEEKLKESKADLGQIKTEIDELESLANAKKECLDRLRNIKGEIDGLAVTYYDFTAKAFENRSVSIEKKLKEPNANLEQIKSEIENLKSLFKEEETLLAINDKIKALKRQGKDTLALERKYANVSDRLNKDDARVEEVQKAVAALKDSLSNVEGLTKVKFNGKGWTHDGTVENVYNSLKDADFDIDRIEDQTWEVAFNFVLKTMNISKDGKTLEAKAKRTACGTEKADYKHKAMLKTLALFAMEREGKVKKGTAKTVADPSTATAENVKIDDIDGLKEFVEGKK